MINHTGPYDFLIDTGAQVTIVETSLADTLHLESRGEIQVVGLGFRMPATVAKLDVLSVGSEAIAKPFVVVQNLRQLRTDLHIRGILGENFLQHFDVLIDYKHHVLCLDNAKAMRSELGGDRIALVSSPRTQDDGELSTSLIVAVRLSGVGKPLLLKLDSGATAPLLFAPPKYLFPALVGNPALRGLSGDGAEKTFAVLSPQNMQIGKHTLSQISFVTLTGARQDVPELEADGLLATGLFRSVFISYSDRFVVLEPW